MNRVMSLVVVLSILVMLVAPIAAVERGTFHFDPERLSQAQKDFSEAVHELNASGDQEFLINTGRKAVERKRKAYDDCVAKKGVEKCGDAYGDFIEVATLYCNRGVKAVEKVEAHLNLAPELRYELGRLFYQQAEVLPDQTLESLRVSLPAPPGTDPTPAQADIAVDLIQSFASRTQQANPGPGGYAGTLSRTVVALEAFRIYFLSLRRDMVQNVAIPEHHLKVLESLGDAVEALSQGAQAPFRGVPLPDKKHVDDYKTLLPKSSNSASPKR